MWSMDQSPPSATFCTYFLIHFLFYYLLRRHLSTREDEIKIHSLIHHQLSAPIFEDMIKYAWFASKLIPERTVFGNVNQICFPMEMRQSKCDCKTCAFIKFAVCRMYLCILCFYNLYYPANC